MKRVLVGMCLFAALGAAAEADDIAGKSPIIKALFGKLPDAGDTSVCFTRVYTPAHLASHPRQNVRDMVVRLTATPDKSVGAVFVTRVGVHFRKLGPAFEVSGGCQLGEGGKTIDCSASCEGGGMDISPRSASTVYLKIPDGAAVWQPGLDTDSTLPRSARFGSDDKIFKLTRAGAGACDAVLAKQ